MPTESGASSAVCTATMPEQFFKEIRETTCAATEMCTGEFFSSIAAVLSRSPMTVKRSLNELENAGLIMRVRQGVGEPNRIYVLIPGKEDAALA